jgi:transposase
MWLRTNCQRLQTHQVDRHAQHLAHWGIGHDQRNTHRVNVLGALNCAAGTLAFAVHEHTVCRQDLVNFLDQQARNSARDKLTVVVMDNASIHRHTDPKVLEEWMVRDRFILLFLPPYSPELNIIEILWKQAKYRWRSFVTRASKDLLSEVQALFDGFGTKFKFSYA